jgi:hypothetical protein
MAVITKKAKTIVVRLIYISLALLVLVPVCKFGWLIYNAKPYVWNEPSDMAAIVNIYNFNKERWLAQIAKDDEATQKTKLYFLYYVKNTIGYYPEYIVYDATGEISDITKAHPRYYLEYYLGMPETVGIVSIIVSKKLGDNFYWVRRYTLNNGYGYTRNGSILEYNQRNCSVFHPPITHVCPDQLIKLPDGSYELNYERVRKKGAKK